MPSDSSISSFGTWQSSCSVSNVRWALRVDFPSRFLFESGTLDRETILVVNRESLGEQRMNALDQLPARPFLSIWRSRYAWRSVRYFRMCCLFLPSSRLSLAADTKYLHIQCSNLLGRRGSSLP